MPLIEKKVLMARCDKCGDRYEHDFVPYYDSVQAAAEDLEQSEWLVLGPEGHERVLCPECIVYEECPTLECGAPTPVGAVCVFCGRVPATTEQEQPPATADDNGGRASDDRGFSGCPAGCVRKLGHSGHHATSPFPYPEDAA